MPKTSAGILLLRHRDSILEVFLVHPGGPFWAKKDLGAWSIPKGEFTADEDPLAAARREFHEETGCAVDGNFISLGSVRQAGGKIVHVWAVEGDLDPAKLRSNLFELEWPPRSGKLASFPEADRGDWFSLASAREKVLASQQPFLDRLMEATETATDR